MLLGTQLKNWLFIIFGNFYEPSQSGGLISFWWKCPFFSHWLRVDFVLFITVSLNVFHVVVNFLYVLTLLFYVIAKNQWSGSLSCYYFLLNCVFIWWGANLPWLSPTACSSPCCLPHFPPRSPGNLPQDYFVIWIILRILIIANNLLFRDKAEVVWGRIY